MQAPTLRLTKRISGYVAGGALILAGLFGLVAEFLERKTSKDIVFGYALTATFVTLGTFVCLASRFRYAGGLWFSIGLALLAMGVVGTSHEMDSVLKHHEDLHGIALSAAFAALGITFLLLGHMRHRRKSRNLGNEDV